MNDETEAYHLGDIEVNSCFGSMLIFPKCGNEIVKVRTFVGRCRTDGLYRIAAKGIDSEKQQHDAAQQLQIKNILIDIIEHKAHTITCQQSISYVA